MHSERFVIYPRYHKDGGVGILAEIEKELHEAHPPSGTPNVAAPHSEVEKYYSRIISNAESIPQDTIGLTQSVLEVRHLFRSLNCDL